VFIKMRSWAVNAAFGVALVFGALSAAHAQTGRSIAVVSLIADGLRVVGQEATTGTMLSRNPTEVTALPFDALELPALKSSMNAVLAADLKAKVLPMKIVDSAIYAAQDSYIANNRAALPKAILEPLLKGNISHLLLITRARAEARLDAKLQTFGSGKLEGVGYYLDSETTTRQQGSGEVAVGFLAPYVYARVSLINLSTLAVERSLTTTVGRVYTATGTGTGGEPWKIMGDAKKIELLRVMIEEQLAETVAKVVTL
jgi:hypothetical protein